MGRLTLSEPPVELKVHTYRLLIPWTGSHMNNAWLMADDSCPNQTIHLPWHQRIVNVLQEPTTQMNYFPLNRGKFFFFSFCPLMTCGPVVLYCAQTLCPKLTLTYFAVLNWSIPHRAALATTVGHGRRNLRH